MGLRIEPVMKELLDIMANLMRNDKKGPSEIAYKGLARLAAIVPDSAFKVLLGE
jgi:hypothetical protein